jgi:hypothetical protein
MSGAIRSMPFSGVSASKSATPLMSTTRRKGWCPSSIRLCPPASTEVSPSARAATTSSTLDALTRSNGAEVNPSPLAESTAVI